MTTGARARVLGPGAGAGMRVAIVAARFNEEVTEKLVAGARRALRDLGVEAIIEVWVPGAFELPLAARRVAESAEPEPDAVVCLGAVIRGETDHYTHIASQCAAGLMQAQLATGLPMVFGVLTTDSLADALERAGGKHGNKGAEAAETAVEMAGFEPPEWVPC